MGRKRTRSLYAYFLGLLWKLYFLPRVCLLLVLISIISWNVRGLGFHKKRVVVKLSKADIAILQKIKLRHADQQLL